MRQTLAVAFLFLSTPWLIADDSDDAEALAKTIAPYLDGQTVAVAHVAASRLRVDQLLDKFADLTKLDRAIVAEPRKHLNEQVERFRRDGGQDVFFVFSLADLPESLCAVVPLGPGADAKALASQFQALGAAERFGAVLIAGRPNTLRRVRQLRPEARPELAKAFAGAGQADAQLLLLPPADLRRSLEESLPVLPKAVGAGPITVLTRGLLWAAVGVKFSPQPSAQLVIQAKDEAAATALADLSARSLKRLGQERQFVRMMPDFEKIASILAPRVSGDRLQVNLDLSQPEVAIAAVSAVASARLVASQRTTMNNLKHFGLALHMYHDQHKSFPAAAKFGKDGKPLLSWRVVVLPYLDQEGLYKQFHLDEPWDSVHNKSLIGRMPAVFCGPNDKLNAAGKTTFLVPVGKDTMFTGGSKGIMLPKDVPDGTSNTIFAVDADDDHAVIWTKPEDLPVDLEKPRLGLSDRFGRGFLALFADGSVRVLPEGIDPKDLRALFTRNGGEVLSKSY